jgi:hypothetical protein
MSPSSVSFRISRHTEDLAETLHALSQRLVAMEQRLVALEEMLLELRHQPREDPLEQDDIARAEEHIERLLLDCRQLLGEEPATRPALLESLTATDARLTEASLSPAGAAPQRLAADSDPPAQAA